MTLKYYKNLKTIKNRQERRHPFPCPCYAYAARYIPKEEVSYVESNCIAGGKERGKEEGVGRILNTENCARIKKKKHTTQRKCVKNKKKKRVEKEERTKNLYINKEGNQQQKQQPKRTNNNKKQSSAKETIHFSTFCFRPCPAKAVKGVGGKGCGCGWGKDVLPIC